MEKTIHFISGLPRSGSTLLSNLMAQHPDCQTTTTSACTEVLFTIRNNWHNWIEHKSSKHLSDEKNLQRVLNAALQAYHNTDKPVVIDKGRGWLSLIELAEFALGRKAKVIVPVRSIAQIVASMEKVQRKAMHKLPEQGDYITAQTTKGRADQMTAGDGVIGLAYNRLSDAFQRGLGDRLHLVEFDALTGDPEATMGGIWDFLGMQAPKHDFNHVEQVHFEDDSVHGLDLHTIRQQVKPLADDSEQILGEPLAQSYRGAEFWRPSLTQPQNRKPQENEYPQQQLATANI